MQTNVWCAQVAVEAERAGAFALFLANEGDAERAGRQARNAARFAFNYLKGIEDPIGTEYFTETIARLRGE